MTTQTIRTFKATLKKIGINPYVSVPEDILNALFEQSGKSKGRIPIRGLINNKPYTQTLVRYRGAWRLYVNTTMLKDSPKRIGAELNISVEFDPDERSVESHPKLIKALKANPNARTVFNDLAPYLQKEIVRYISNLKSDKAIDRNVDKAINFLLGKERFIGRDKP